MGVNDYRAEPPITLVGYLIILFKFYSAQIKTIKDAKNTPGILFILTFMLTLPYYAMSYGKEGIRPKENKGHRLYQFIRMLMYIGQLFLCYVIITCIFTFLPIPWNVIASCFKGYLAIPIIIGSGIVVITMFTVGSSVFSFASTFYNVLGGYNFIYYQDRAFFATSVGEFWKRWNFWGSEWFVTYMYKPLRRKWKFTHDQATLAIFTFSALVHAYVVAMVNIYFAWLTFFVFFINGVVVCLEKPAVKKFPFLSKMPVWLKFILTFLFLDITLGLFGLCFTKWSM